MRDCANVEVRDALPELVHDRLPAVERERVLAHVAGCADCTAELAVLRGARRVIDRAGPAVDAAAIARAVQARLAADAASARLPATAPAPRPAWVTPRAPRSRWASRPTVRALAAALVMAIGFGGAMLARRDGGPPAERIVQVEPAAPPAVGGADSQAVAAPAPVERAAEPAAAGAPTLALGETFADLSEDELAFVIDAINDEDARLPASEPASYETLPLEPMPGRDGGNP